MLDRNMIINKLREALEPLPFIYAFWLEGADAIGTTDEYSDIDLWVDFEDAYEEPAYEAVENALGALAGIDYKYVMPHEHPKIRQRIYHLAGTSKYLMIDFCWQLHSRPQEEYIYYENDRISAAKVVFDKDQIIRHKLFDLSEVAKNNQSRLEEAKYRRTQQIRAVKYVRRGQYLEAYAYYNRYVLEPLIDLLRLIYTPAYADYYLLHISQHIPTPEREKLEYFARIGSLDDKSEKIVQAGQWFDELVERLGEENTSMDDSVERLTTRPLHLKLIGSVCAGQDIFCRKATTDDVEMIIQMDHLHRHEQISKAVIQEECYIAEDTTQIIGFAIMDYSFFHCGFVALLIVKEEYRRRGIGAALLDYLFLQCKTEKLFTSTNESNTPMRELLRKSGFIPCGQIDALDEGDPELFFVRKKEAK
ncbi:MAG: GNAT family N-acetyltransferase [Bacillota bacterium]|nr:GNAT family N-acetyltransferase [Bacillota bacterium]